MRYQIALKPRLELFCEKFCQTSTFDNESFFWIILVLFDVFLQAKQNIESSRLAGHCCRKILPAESTFHKRSFVSLTFFVKLIFFKERNGAYGTPGPCCGPYFRTKFVVQVVAFIKAQMCGVLSCLFKIGENL